MLKSTVRRLRALHVLTAVAAGAGGAAVATAGVTLIAPAWVAVTASGAALLVTAAILWRVRRSWDFATAARLLERHAPQCRNVIITAEELARYPERAGGWMRARVFADAAAAAASLEGARAVPLARASALAAAALGAWLVVTVGWPWQAATVGRRIERTARSQAAGSTGAPRLTVTLVAPPYLGGHTRVLHDPARIEAVEGSRLSAALAGDGSWRLRLGRTILSSTSAGSRQPFTVVLDGTTYLALEAEGQARGDHARLIPVIVTPDHAPAIRVEAPGRDLVLPDSQSVVTIAASATDDFGLTSFDVRYTRVSGSGEQFEFEEGRLPLAIERATRQNWKGRAALALSTMKLQPGDSLVYRVVAADERGGQRGESSSETFFVEIAGPGQATLAGLSLPPDRDRYALSQQMIVIKIERLRRRERSLSPEELSRQMADLAAEQRAVRANFIFLTGGHVEDEEEEAAHSHEVQEGRLEHTARREISLAIQHMSRVEVALGGLDSGEALPPAKAAVEALQRAFGRNRYLLRALPVRSRVDPARRLAGSLEEAADSTRLPPDARVDPHTSAAREILTEFLDLLPAVTVNANAEAGVRLREMAEQALAVGAAVPEWQQISTALLHMRDAVLQKSSAAERHARASRVVLALRNEVRKRAVHAVPHEEDDRELRSAWAEERRRR